MFDKFVMIIIYSKTNGKFNYSYRQTNYKPQQKYRVGQRSIITSALFDKTLKNNEQIIDNLTINPPNQRLLTIELLLLR